MPYQPPPTIQGPVGQHHPGEPWNTVSGLYNQGTGSATVPTIHPAGNTRFVSTARDLPIAPIPTYDIHMAPASPRWDGSPIASPSPEEGRTSSLRSMALLSDAGSSSQSNQRNQLTSEQLITLQTLYSLDVPAAEIASVMERMRTGQPAFLDSSDSHGGVIRGDAVKDPPLYDFKDSHSNRKGDFM